MPPEEFSYTLSFADIDQSLLPPESRVAGTPAFRTAIQQYLEGQYRDFGGRVQILVNDSRQEVDVRWSPEPGGPDPEAVVLDLLRRRDYGRAIPLLELLRRHQPTNPTHPYNLGMLFSDLGQIERARTLLRESLRLDPGNVNALVALGVAQIRGNDTEAAVTTLREAVATAPDNPWAHRNLGGCLLKLDRAAEAEPHLRRAVELQPGDQQALYGLGQALEALGRPADADECYIRAIDVDPTNPLADRAKRARSELGHRSFREKAAGGERLDAVMYLVGGLETFERMTPQEVQRVTFEIATLGMRGIDANDPAPKYTLKSLPGTYSGLHLMCLMYLGFKQVAPAHDIRFDLAREYESAKAMHAARKAK